MRSFIIGACAAAGLGLFATTASAAPLSSKTLVAPESLVEQVQSGRYCARLRRACEFKNERGEAGEGNCRRYRQECGRGYRSYRS
jgi:hypothetical protein